MQCFLVSALFVLAVRTCANRPEVSTDTETSPSPEAVASDCLKSLPTVAAIRKEESSEDVEAEADKLEEQGKGKEALSKYSEAYLLYQGEWGYALGRNMRGDPSFLMELNRSVESPEFPFKVGRAFAQSRKHEIAIGCFTESLTKQIDAPNDASAYLNRGASYSAIAQKDKARQDYQKSVDLFQKYKLPDRKKEALDRLRTVTP